MPEVAQWAITDLPPRMAKKIALDADTGCWRWTAGKFQGTGYAAFWWQGQNRLGHRFVYELLIGPIATGMHVDHVLARGCIYRDCVNPAHLEMVTPRENALRSPLTSQSINAAKTHCPGGHPYAGENLYVKPCGRRVCRTCTRNQARLYQRELRARRKRLTTQ